MSTKVQKDFLDQIAAFVKDGSGSRAVLQTTEQKLALATALRAYSRLKPLVVVLDVPVTSSVLNTANLTGFDFDFNSELSIEYPISTGGEPNTLDRRSWSFYRSPSGIVIRFLDEVTNAAEVRVTYCKAHSIDTRSHEQTDLATPAVAISTTVPDVDFEAICKKGAAEQFKMLAGYYNQTGEGGSFVNADFQFVRGKPDSYLSLAKRADDDWKQLMGIGDEKNNEVTAASVTVNWDTRSSIGTDRATHPRRLR